MTKTVLVPIANDTEELEAVVIVNVLRRAGLSVKIASIENDLCVRCSRNVKICADVKLVDVKNEHFDLIVLPGGMPGAERLSNCEELIEMLKEQKKHENRYIGAICASPAIILQKHHLLETHHQAVSYPSFMSHLPNPGQKKVTVSHHIVTATGPGTAMDFALKLVELLCGKEKMTSVKDGLLVENLQCDHDIKC